MCAFSRSRISFWCKSSKVFFFSMWFFKISSSSALFFSSISWRFSRNDSKISRFWPYRFHIFKWMFDLPIELNYILMYISYKIYYTQAFFSRNCEPRITSSFLFSCFFWTSSVCRRSSFFSSSDAISRFRFISLSFVFDSISDLVLSVSS